MSVRIDVAALPKRISARKYLVAHFRLQKTLPPAETYTLWVGGRMRLLMTGAQLNYLMK